MKNLKTILLLAVALPLGVLAQQNFIYSGIARDAQGSPLAQSSIGIEISILQDSLTGANKYTETHQVSTDPFGVFSLEVGSGALQSGAYSSIDWSGANRYIKVALDATGGSNYVDSYTTQIYRVPTATHSLKADTAMFVQNLPAYLLQDTSATNELQLLEVVGDSLNISNGNAVKLPSNNSLIYTNDGF